MIKTFIRLFALSTLIVGGCSNIESETPSDSFPNDPPNILLILIDDLGYTDLGVYGGDVDTPNIDSLADDSTIFSNAHAYPSCGPTRASLMTGQDPHRVGFGSQNGFAPPGVSLNTPGYSGSLEGEYVGIAEQLSKAGYKSYQSGKWHLGHTDSVSPGSLGFDRNFTLLDGAASHYADMKTISLDVSKTGLASYERNGHKLHSLPADFYSTKNFTDELLSMLKVHNNKEAPFFAYLAYTAVHDPLHAPDDLIAKYLNRYSGDFTTLRDTRIRNAKKEGLFPKKDYETRWLTDVSEFYELSDLSKQDLRYRMAVYGAMIEYLDTQVGRIITSLKKTGQYENTLIILLSDNGAALAPRTVYARGEKSKAWQAQAYPDNSLMNYGKATSYPTLGILNAQAISGPLFGGKTSVYEGGTRIPMIVKVPNKNTLNVTDAFMHVSDIYPTLTDFAKLDDLDSSGLLGDSAKAFLEGRSKNIGDTDFGLEYFGARAFRSGDWKLVFAEPAFGGTGKWALYNLKDDPGETNDIAHKNSEKVSELVEKWYQYAEENGVVVAPMKLVNEFGERTKSLRLSTDWAIE